MPVIHPTMKPRTLAAALFAILLTLLFCWVAIVLSSCSPAATEHAVVTAAEVANEVSRRSSEVYAVSIEACNTAEVAASQLPSVEDAKATVAKIREQCDVAFDSIEKVRQAIAAMDAVVATVDTGAEAARKLSAAVLAAHAAVENAERINRELATFLGSVK